MTIAVARRAAAGAAVFVLLISALASATGCARAIVAAEPSAQQPPSDIPTASTDPRELANQVNNPAAPVTILQFRNVTLPDVAGTTAPRTCFRYSRCCRLVPSPRCQSCS